MDASRQNPTHLPVLVEAQRRDAPNHKRDSHGAGDAEYGQITPFENKRHARVISHRTFEFSTNSQSQDGTAAEVIPLFVVPGDDDSYLVVRRYLLNVLTRTGWGIEIRHHLEIQAVVQNWVGKGCELLRRYRSNQLHGICPASMVLTDYEGYETVLVAPEVRQVITMCILHEMKRYFDSLTKPVRSGAKTHGSLAQASKASHIQDGSLRVAPLKPSQQQPVKSMQKQELLNDRPPIPQEWVNLDAQLLAANEVWYEHCESYRQAASHRSTTSSSSNRAQSSSAYPSKGTTPVSPSLPEAQVHIQVTRTLADILIHLPKPGPPIFPIPKRHESQPIQCEDANTSDTTIIDHKKTTCSRRPTVSARGAAPSSLARPRSASVNHGTSGPPRVLKVRDPYTHESSGKTTPYSQPMASSSIFTVKLDEVGAAARQRSREDNSSESMIREDIPFNVLDELRCSEGAPLRSNRPLHTDTETNSLTESEREHTISESGQREKRLEPDIGSSLSQRISASSMEPYVTKPEANESGKCTTPRVQKDSLPNIQATMSRPSVSVREVVDSEVDISPPRVSHQAAGAHLSRTSDAQTAHSDGQLGHAMSPMPSRTERRSLGDKLKRALSKLDLRGK